MPYHPLHHRRVALLAVVLLLVVAIGRSAALQGALHDVLTVVERLIRTYPRAGVALFLVLAGLSAMLSFFSSTALVPVRMMSLTCA